MTCGARLAEECDNNEEDDVESLRITTSGYTTALDMKSTSSWRNAVATEGVI